MTTMNISLPENLKSYVDQRMTSGDYSSASEYVRELIRLDRDSRELRATILEGTESPLSEKNPDELMTALRALARAAAWRPEHS
ncbi:MAG: type II toxin-antitoxin system ParD family antitoxin [Ancrocorticia sp.]|nr:type II toxin-antitoxin system ParD family antitoxin [Ancrocorticia sp.]